MNLSRLALLSAALVGTWCLQMIGIFQFQTALISGPPQFHIVDFDHWPEEGEEIVAGRTYTSQESADEQLAEFHRNQWLGLLGAIIGITATFRIAKLLFESKSLALSAVFAGPLFVAYFVARSFWR